MEVVDGGILLDKASVAVRSDCLSPYCILLRFQELCLIDLRVATYNVVQ